MEGTEIQPEFLSKWDAFVESKSGVTDRELLIESLWHSRQCKKRITELHELVEKIENEADQAMKSLTDPGTMMQAAQKFLGG